MNTLTSALRPIVVSTVELYTENFFGHTTEESDANLPLWSAQMSRLADRDGVSLTIVSGQLSSGRTYEVEGYDRDENPHGGMEDTDEALWFGRASEEAWAAVNGALVSALLPQIEAWRVENPDAAGIYPKIDLDALRVEGTQDAGDSWDGRSDDTSDWRIVDLGTPLGEVAVHGGGDRD